MIRFTQGLAVVVLSSVTLSAAAQDFTTQDPRYTTTPPEYTTTPAQYTTTPSQYTTTPPAYVPQADTVPVIGGDLPSIPSNGIGGRNNSGLPTSTNLGNITAPQTLQTQALAEVTAEEEPEIVETPSRESPNETEPLVEWLATFVLRLNEVETQQMVSDYNAVVAQLGLEPGELSGSTRFKIVLYLMLGRLWSSSGLGLGAAG